VVTCEDPDPVLVHGDVDRLALQVALLVLGEDRLPGFAEVGRFADHAAHADAPADHVEHRAAHGDTGVVAHGAVLVDEGGPRARQRQSRRW
jgi:hypothetical protein